MFDTIFALTTPPGKSGVAIIRLSGPHAQQALARLTGMEKFSPRYAHYVTLRSASGTIIDRALAIYFPAPASFTGEDVAELHIHGSLAIMRELLDALAAFESLRPAEPGEFTRRAFINGKMDLIEAEGLADLIAAETSQQKTQALRQMQGELSGYYDMLRTRIIQCLAHLEAYIDFPDEEIPESVLAGLSGEINDVQVIIRQALEDEARGERLREGIHVVILGAPNAGKSSLLNLLAQKDAAIVSHRAGTTRDTIEIHMDICGYPVILVDTAGIRATTDDIEEEGVRRALARADTADIRLVLFDGSAPELDKRSLSLVNDRTILVINKSDILIRSNKPFQDKAIMISAKTGEGVETLLKQIETRIVGFFSSHSAAFITRNRHRALLSEASNHLGKSLKPMALELKCEELRLAAQAIGKITGKIQVDEVLDVIFRQFCIGK